MEERHNHIGLSHSSFMQCYHGVIPSLFKKAIVHPVYKGHGKNLRDPGFYRPVVIVPSLSKGLEVAVRRALLSWFEDNHFLPQTQYAFRPGRSVSMALTLAQTDWIDAKSKKEAFGVMAFDLSSSFDTLEPSILLSKLERAGIKGTQLQWFHSYLSDHSQTILWNDVVSKPLCLRRGVPQGSILGPILFLAMIYDMPDRLTRSTLTTLSKVVGYADDTTVYAQRHL